MLASIRGSFSSSGYVPLEEGPLQEGRLQRVLSGHWACSHKNSLTWAFYEKGGRVHFLLLPNGPGLSTTH